MLGLKFSIPLTPCWQVSAALPDDTIGQLVLRSAATLRRLRVRIRGSLPPLPVLEAATLTIDRPIEDIYLHVRVLFPCVASINQLAF